jgi:hypothetical protein
LVDPNNSGESTLLQALTIWGIGLRKAGCRLEAEMESMNPEQVLSRMNLLTGPPEHRRLRDVALMLFNETPERFFRFQEKHQANHRADDQADNLLDHVDYQAVYRLRLKT